MRVVCWGASLSSSLEHSQMSAVCTNLMIDLLQKVAEPDSLCQVAVALKLVGLVHPCLKTFQSPSDKLVIEQDG